MYNLPDCPVCGEEADWMLYDSDDDKNIYFCMSCCEHFDSDKNVIKSPDGIIGPPKFNIKITFENIGEIQ